MYLHPVETQSRDQLAQLQLQRLRETLARAVRSPFYRRLLAQTGVAPETLRDLTDLRHLPFTCKEDLRAQYPYGLVACERADLVRLHVSSGTTGVATVVFHTASDLAHWTELVARCMYMVGMRRKDVFQNMTGYGMFTGGLGMHYGAERLGCLTVPAGAGNTQRQVQLLRDFSVTAIHVIPSYALYLGAYLEREGIDPATLSLRVALVGAEPYTDEARRRIEMLLGAHAYNSYGLSEMNGPGVAFECPEQDGMHLWEDAYLAEVVDPQTLLPVPDGELGELVLTTLQRDGMPILRYRTKDLTRFLPGVCPCGRTHRRIDRIAGRSDDMLIIKGVNIFPMQIEQVLMAIPAVAQNYLVIVEHAGEVAQLRVQVEINDEHYAAASLPDLAQRIAHKLRDEILVMPRVDLLPRHSLSQTEGKAQRVVHRLLEA